MALLTTARPTHPSARLPLRRATASPQVALVLTTYQRPGHLRRVLASIALQRGVLDQLELVVADDGSTDDTPQVVDEFARSVRFPVHFTTHPHTLFRAGKCRNEGVAATTAPYLLFVDGDCVLPPDHVLAHLDHRRPNHAMGGYCCRLDKAISERITVESIRAGEYLGWIPRRELRSLAMRDYKSRFYSLIRHPSKPKLAGGNVGMWRSDYQRINGFDENFEGWGAEDDDLANRLLSSGVRVGSILRWTRTYHLWHPVDPSAPSMLRYGVNVQYLHRSGRLRKCRNGLAKRRVQDLNIQVVGKPAIPEVVPCLLTGKVAPHRVHTAQDRPEVEILFLPGSGNFSGRADCNVLVVFDESPRAQRLARKAHFVVADGHYDRVPGDRCFRLEHIDEALEAIT